ncbi:Hypothetical_protein [Hexamita inflata]|uniref:Hypothetical_protein n=1 Tax=Hexamita inflata TaxID=28002 RepID=A0AA86NX92_9EUKA|nr:Hypothetical protein HINF_LOCUS14420 [Hexamita inflata]
MSRRATPPSQSPVEKFSDDENTILEPALRSIRYDGKIRLSNVCYVCAEGKYHELQSPNARQVVQHLLLHNIHREQMIKIPIQIGNIGRAGRFLESGCCKFVKKMIAGHPY